MKKNLSKTSFLINYFIRKRSHLEIIKKYNNPFILAFSKAKKRELSKSELNVIECLESYRLKLTESKQQVHYNIFGLDEYKNVSEIVSKASTSKQWAIFYYLLSKKINAKNILEIGTNVGISGQYFISALMDNKLNIEDKYFLSFEGVKDLCTIANKRFDQITKKELKYDIIEGLYDDTLEKGLEDKKTKFDLIFIDGNHKFKPTINYFELIKKNYSTENSIYIFDDINWSNEMKRAWKVLKNEPCISIDMHRIGVLIFQKDIKESIKTKMYLSF